MNPPPPEEPAVAADAGSPYPAGTRPFVPASTPIPNVLGGAMDRLDPSQPGPLDRPTAIAMLERADTLLASSEFAVAGVYYQRVFGFPEPSISAAALYGVANVLYRLDREEEALQAWDQVTRLGETPVTYAAWRQVAASRVRAKDLSGAVRAYKEAERRAPAQDRAEIASRLGWLAKEQGDTGTARRYFAASRGGGAQPILTFLIIGLTCVVSLTALFGQGDGQQLLALLALDKPAVAAGEYWRLWSVTLIHGSLLHLFFNMYALYIAGTLVEQLYGWPMYLLIYLLSAAAGSVGSFLFGGDIPSVGASGAIFGLFGVLLAVSRTHHPILDRRGQALISQIGTLIAINLFIGFAIPGIDNFAHIGGLVAGLWLGFILPPSQVATLANFWRRPDGAPLETQRQGAALLRALGVLALVVAIGLGVMVGTDARHNNRPVGGLFGSVPGQSGPASAGRDAVRLPPPG